METLTEVRKDDDMYFCGPFWIISDSLKDIQKGDFSILSEKIMCDYYGDYSNDSLKRKGSTSHKKLWSDFSAEFGGVSYDYFPRGRVRIVNGEVFIHLNSKVNTPRVVNAILREFGLENFTNSEINIEEDGLLQGSHYSFLLK